MTYLEYTYHIKEGMDTLDLFGVVHADLGGGSHVSRLVFEIHASPAHLVVPVISLYPTSRVRLDHEDLGEILHETVNVGFDIRVIQADECRVGQRHSLVRSSELKHAIKNHHPSVPSHWQAISIGFADIADLGPSLVVRLDDALVCIKEPRKEVGPIGQIARRDNLLCSIQVSFVRSKRSRSRIIEHAPRNHVPQAWRP